VSLKYHLWMCGRERGVDSIGRGESVGRLMDLRMSESHLNFLQALDFKRI
jgi:hypothetical protein